MENINQALLSVSDKTGIIELAKELKEQKIKILSTGGTAKILKEKGIEIREVADYTGFPEMLDGRVKTLHPKIHGGLLALRDNEIHLKKLKEQGIELIDMVVVNLYPFEAAISKEGISLEEAIENIDIGGPTLIRSAAKNFISVVVITNPKKYSLVIKELKENNGRISLKTRRELSIEAFAHTARYDSIICNYLEKKFRKKDNFPYFLNLNYQKIMDLRYGENPHQKASFYKQLTKDEKGIIKANKIQGKELSFNNIVDLNSAVEIVKEFEQPAVAIIKHANPCGVACGEDVNSAYKKALKCDSLSAFGGIIGINRICNKELAKEITSSFFEAIIAFGFEEEAKEIFQKKEKIILLEIKDNAYNDELVLKSIRGGLLVQEEDKIKEVPAMFKIVTYRKPTDLEIKTMLFALKVVKYVKSNAIVLAKQNYTIGIGAGQMSRIDALKVALMKKSEDIKGAILASDAFFPKPDVIEEAAKVGITGIIQPGGSIQDEASIEIANKNNMTMVFTGIRHFLH